MEEYYALGFDSKKIDYKIRILFESRLINKYINSDKLIIGGMIFKIRKLEYNNFYKNCMTDYEFEICVDTSDQKTLLNNIFDFFIKENCVYYVELISEYFYQYSSLYDIDKNLFYKSAYWILNSDKLEMLPQPTFYYLLMTLDNKFILFCEKIISEKKLKMMEIPVHKDLSIINFIFDRCQKNMSKEIFDKLSNKFFKEIDRYMTYSIEIHDINFFYELHKNNVLELYVNHLNNSRDMAPYKCGYDKVIDTCLKLGRLEIIDYLTYGLS